MQDEKNMYLAWIAKVLNDHFENISMYILLHYTVCEFPVKFAVFNTEYFEFYIFLFLGLDNLDSRNDSLNKLFRSPSLNQNFFQKEKKKTKP